MGCLSKPMVRWLGHHATGAGAHHPHGDRRRDRPRGRRSETLDATRLGDGDRHLRSDRSRHHLDHHRPLPAGRRHGHAHPEHATTQAAARYRVSGGTVPLEEAVGLEKLGVKVPTLTLTME